MFAGLDVGRRRDRTALVTLEGSTVTRVVAATGLSLPDQARRLAPTLRRCALVAVDATGLGLGLAEMLAEAGVPVLPVTITGSSRVGHALPIGVDGPEQYRNSPGTGENATAGGFPGLSAGKPWLIGRVRAALATRALSVAPACPNRALLLRELSSMMTKTHQTGHTRLEASAGHDDTVLALALALLASDVHGKEEGRARGSAGRG